MHLLCLEGNQASGLLLTLALLCETSLRGSGCMLQQFLQRQLMATIVSVLGPGELCIKYA